MKSWKSSGSGDVDHVPPNTDGYVTCSHIVVQPPDECPVRKRVPSVAVMRQRDSRYGMSSAVSAWPSGPLFTESANTP